MYTRHCCVLCGSYLCMCACAYVHVCMYSMYASLLSLVYVLWLCVPCTMLWLWVYVCMCLSTCLVVWEFSICSCTLNTLSLILHIMNIILFLYTVLFEQHTNKIVHICIVSSTGSCVVSEYVECVVYSHPMHKTHAHILPWLKRVTVTLPDFRHCLSPSVP